RSRLPLQARHLVPVRAGRSGQARQPARASGACLPRRRAEDRAGPVAVVPGVGSARALTTLHAVVTTIATALADAGKPLPGVFHKLEGSLHDYGYFAVAGFLFFEDFGVPLPGETMLIAASLYAGAGHLNVFLVGIVGFL